MRFVLLVGGGVLSVLASMAEFAQAEPQERGGLRLARRETAADEEFLPLPTTEPENDPWWKPTMPKWSAPKLTMPKLPAPKTPQWVQRANQGTRQAWNKTRNAMTAPFQSWSKPINGSRRPSSRQDQPGFWSRVFGGAPEPTRPTTVSEFLGGQRPRMGD